VRIDVFYGIEEVTPADVAGRVVAVIDVLRASTTIAAALYAGARTVVPFASPDEVVLRSKEFERRDVRLAGERKMRAIPGFDFGNSPLEFTPAAVEGKTVLITTTNGTVALVGVAGARDVVVASYANFTPVLHLMRAALRGGTDVSIVGAGRERHYSLEDAACAGRYVREIVRDFHGVALNDAARAAVLLDEHYGQDINRLFEDSVHGRLLIDAGFAADLKACAQIDAYPVVPIYQERQITKLGPNRER